MSLNQSAAVSAVQYLGEIISIGGALIEVLESAIQLSPDDPSIAAPITDLEHLASAKQSSPPSPESRTSRLDSTVGAATIKTFKRDLASVKRTHAKMLAAGEGAPSWKKMTSKMSFNSAWLASELMTMKLPPRN
ncbi:hypothetical protein CF319_g9210 [Tilletia indica]|uniref:Uncharacterized protein n=1 Tax=Tilletia indica TaxID=43049 RepID=A0A8T8SG17_9BASI|nr:hypothetical protein CF319_g9210 [Tilletia indica]KAE8239595.1 hypothetical protein A4X13_0g8126 [Tilletia indica]